uniref:hypothetical protein n=1 Tax=Dictyobacter formicarum TaxID=2778368 RepID=UPI001916BDA2|nr:hypothetical protein [Dictyobacter formicarum]
MGRARVTGKSSTLWAGRSIKSEAIRPCGGIGNWCAAPFPFVGIIKPVPPRQSHCPFHPSLLPSPLKSQESRKKNEPETGERLQVSWPKALRAVRGWLEPWVLLQRFWLAWSLQPPPLPLQQLFEHLWRGSPLYLYATY